MTERIDGHTGGPDLVRRYSRHDGEVPRGGFCDCLSIGYERAAGALPCSCGLDEADKE